MSVHNSEFTHFSSNDATHGEYLRYYTPENLRLTEQKTIYGIVEAKLNYHSIQSYILSCAGIIILNILFNRFNKFIYINIFF
jgi:hypothetical protein